MNSRMQSEASGERRPLPLMVFDGECGFCRRWILRWQVMTGDRVVYAPWQEAAGEFPHIPVERFKAAVQLVEPDGRVSGGAEAVFRGLAYVPGRGGWFWAYEYVPGFRAVSEAGYRFIARHRRGLSSLDRWWYGKDARLPTYLLTRRFFFIGLGLVYFVAFASLGVQIVGLVGQNGILPAGQYLEAAREQLGPEAPWRIPTLAWFDSSDAALRGMCVGGAALSCLLVLGVAPVLMLVLLWVLYLSLSGAAQTFLDYQWDILLLETGFLAILLASWRFWPRPADEPPPSVFALWLVRWLLFRLLFGSGIVKLLSGDATWRDFTAMPVHYETQPLPIWTSWFVYHLPEWFHRASVIGMYAIELVVPFFIFLGHRLRIVACVLFVVLQATIAATGNYTFFNLLTVVLCIPLLDDRLLRWFLPRRWGERVVSVASRPRRPRFQCALTGVVGLVVIVASGLRFYGQLYSRAELPEWGQRLLVQIAPLRSVNTYGLFAEMTTERPEIIIEGSHDGREWREYEFKWKPGDVGRRPGLVAPHQPRLDWQMWFAALGSRSSVPVVMNLMVRLLEGAPEVLELLAENPFADEPPVYIRAVVYDYRFTDVETRRATGAWWRREWKGLYTTPMRREASHR
jgi:predicted DCC family thiol-disulfide oxidoreductase YuxK